MLVGGGLGDRDREGVDLKVTGLDAKVTGLAKTGTEFAAKVAGLDTRVTAL